MVPGHMEVIGLGGDGMLMTYIRSAGGHLLLGKFSCLLALKMWHLVVREWSRYFVKGFVLKAKEMGEHDCVELSQEQPASGKLQNKWFAFLCCTLCYSFYKCCQWANNTCCQSLNRLFYSIFWISVVTILEFLTSIRYLEKYRYSIPFSIPGREKNCHNIKGVNYFFWLINITWQWGIFYMNKNVLR